MGGQDDTIWNDIVGEVGGTHVVDKYHLSGREGHFRERIRKPKMLVGEPEVLQKACLEKRRKAIATVF